MSLETLLEAAKYVEYQTEAKARGEEPHDYHTFSKLCSASKDGQYSPVARVTPPKRQQTFSNSSQSSEEAKEKRRSHFLKESGSHDHHGTGTREVHNKLEKNRRAHLKECFDALKKQLPNMDDRKTSNLSILRGAIRFIQILKRKERDYEHDMERLAREKIAFQQRLSILKKDLSAQLDHVDVNTFIPEEDNETTTTASECGALSDFDDNDPEDTPPMKNSATASDFASSSSSSTTNSVLVRPASTTTATPRALPKPSIKKEHPATNHHYVVENKAPVHPPMPTPHPVSMSHTDGNSAQPTRVFSTNNLHTMTGIFPHGMQVITQSSGIKVITSPIMAPSSAPLNPTQIHVLAPNSNNPSYISSAVSSGKPFCADSMVQVAASGNPPTKGGLARPHLVSPLTLVSPQTMVELNQGAKAHIAEMGSINLSQKGVLSSGGNMAIAMKNSVGNPSNMVATLHVSKHSQMIQSSMGPSIITQGGSHLNNGTHSGISSLKPIVSNPVRSLPHITGIAHVVSQSPMQAPVGQIVTPGNHVTPLVSVVSHTGAVHQQPIGKVLAASPVLKSVNQLNSIPIIQQQFQPIVKPVVVVSMPSVATSVSNLSQPTTIVNVAEQTGVVRGSK
ncbi:hypothetical protein JTE90_021413 [Oedothorax gibbosus]|uniref:Max-binding protein MNT n=1 Tax=Oedothorax gibbosus TaxID=931172 RepID=A0AAV6VE30_9ARAC|nr:hypothetical protein JTE90_021413 [Oedothorax gibbosus]